MLRQTPTTFLSPLKACDLSVLNEINRYKNDSAILSQASYYEHTSSERIDAVRDLLLPREKVLNLFGFPEQTLTDSPTNLSSNSNATKSVRFAKEPQFFDDSAKQHSHEISAEINAEDPQEDKTEERADNQGTCHFISDVIVPWIDSHAVEQLCQLEDLNANAFVGPVDTKECLPQHELYVEVLVYEEANEKKDIGIYHNVKAHLSCQKKFLLLNKPCHQQCIYNQRRGPCFTAPNVAHNHAYFVPICEFVDNRGRRINRICSFQMAVQELFATACKDHPGYQKRFVLRCLSLFTYVSPLTPAHSCMQFPDVLEKLEVSHEASVLHGIAYDEKLFFVRNFVKGPPSPRSVDDIRPRVSILFERLSASDNTIVEKRTIETAVVKNECTKSEDSMCLIDNVTLLPLSLQKISLMMSHHAVYTMNNCDHKTFLCIHLETMHRGEKRRLYSITLRSHSDYFFERKNPVSATQIHNDIMKTIQSFYTEMNSEPLEPHFNAIR